MMYVLNQEELDRLVDKSELNAAKAAVASLRRMVVPDGRCVNDGNGPRYCDACPLSDIGGDFHKEARPTQEMSRLMCTLHRRYSK